MPAFAQVPSTDRPRMNIPPPYDLPFELLLFFLLLRRLSPPISTLFPYTTLFRSLLFLRRHLAAPGFHHVGDQEHVGAIGIQDRKSTRLNSSHLGISYAVFCLKKKRTSLTVSNILFRVSSFPNTGREMEKLTVREF